MSFLAKLKPSQLFSPIFLKRCRKFTTLKRGYYAFIIIIILYGASFFSEFLINSNPLWVTYKGKKYFTCYDIVKLKKDVLDEYKVLAERASDLRKKSKMKKFLPEERTQYKADAKVARAESRQVMKIKRALSNGRALKVLLEELNPNYSVTLAPYPFGPIESLLTEMAAGINPPTRPDKTHWMGTDDRGRDVFARLIYGFRTGISFSLVVTVITYIIGISLGAVMGYYGGKFDLMVQRFVEVWSSMPFLYTVMIVAAVMEPNFMLLVVILTLFGWMGMTYYIRGEFYREKNRDYVQAAIAMGQKDYKIIFKHILPNSLTPAISFAPFAVVGNISSLVSLDFLGFGLPAPTPSWGELLGQGLGNLDAWWLAMCPLGALFCTLLLVSFIGEAVREAFDPKVYSRLR